MSDSALARIEFSRDELNLSLTLPDAPVVALTGANGAGKTTVIRCLAGLEEAARVEWIELTPHTIGYLPQRVSLYPTMSLLANVASSLRFTGVARSEAETRAIEMLGLVDLVDLADRRPHEVSGGQRQRAGLARAIIARPELLLLDEPFNAVDVASRDRVRRAVIDHIVASGSRCVIATHDDADIAAAHALVVEVA